MNINGERCRVGGQGKPMTRISTNVNRLSAFCHLMVLRGSTKMTTQLLKAESGKRKAESGKRKTIVSKVSK